MSKKKKQPEYRAQYYVDSFKDYTGAERKFTLCAVTIPITDIYGKGFTGCMVPKYPVDVAQDWNNTIYDMDMLDENIIHSYMNVDLTKMIKIGIAVQCVDDEYNEEIGQKIAYGKAVKYYDHILIVSRPGMINTIMVDALLQQEAEHFKKNPESYIPSYNKRKKNWEFEQSLIKEYYVG